MSYRRPSHRGVWFAAAFCLVGSASARAGDPPADARKILVCVSSTAASALRDLADQWVDTPARVPALRAILDAGAAPGGVELVDADGFTRAGELWDRNPDFTRLAYNHLVLLGRWDGDPLLVKTQGWTAAVDTAAPSFYAEGYGRFTGGAGLIESGPNPWLHCSAVDACPYETLLFRVAGSTDEGTLHAAKAFESGLLNGLALAPDAQRAEKSLLDLQPAVDACPLRFPATVDLPESHAPGTARFMGWTQSAADEYRAYLDVGGHEPERLWRLKWLGAGVLDRMTRDTWWNGPHRMASGNAVVAARFATPAAAATAEGMARQGWTAWEHDGVRGWQGKPTPNLTENNNRPLYAAARGKWLVLSGLPESVTATWIDRHVRD